MGKEIEDLQQLKSFIGEHPAVLLYFYNNSCQPCKVLRPKVKEMLLSEFPEMKMVKVNTILFPDIAVSYQVYASPTLIVLFEGKETIRRSQYISLSELSADIGRVYHLLFD